MRGRADTSGTHNSILHSTLDFGGGRTASADYTADVSLGGFGGIGQTLDPSITARQGYSGQLNEPPSAHDDAIHRLAGSSMKLFAPILLANDFDLENDALTITAVSPNSENGILVAMEGPWISYAPPAGFDVADTFTYTVTDGCGVSAVGKVDILVTGSSTQQATSTPHIELGERWPNGAQPLRLELPGLSKTILEMSTNLENWSPIWTNTPLGELVDYVDDSDSPSLLYRTMSTLIGPQALVFSQLMVATNGPVRLVIQKAGQQTVLEKSSDLFQWRPIMTNLVNGAEIQYIDDRTPRLPCIFYRAISKP